MGAGEEMTISETIREGENGKWEVGKCIGTIEKWESTWGKWILENPREKECDGVMNNWFED